MISPFLVPATFTAEESPRTSPEVADMLSILRCAWLALWLQGNTRRDEDGRLYDLRGRLAFDPWRTDTSRTLPEVF